MSAVVSTFGSAVLPLYTQSDRDTWSRPGYSRGKSNCPPISFTQCVNHMITFKAVHFRFFTRMAMPVFWSYKFNFKNNQIKYILMNSTKFMCLKKISCSSHAYMYILCIMNCMKAVIWVIYQLGSIVCCTCDLYVQRAADESA